MAFRGIRLIFAALICAGTPGIAEAVVQPDSPHWRYVESLYRRGYSKGCYSDGKQKFCPGTRLTRDQLFVFVQNNRPVPVVPAGRFRISENDSPRPVDRFIPGFERTFFDGSGGSVGIRLPFFDASANFTRTRLPLQSGGTYFDTIRERSLLGSDTTVNSSGPTFSLFFPSGAPNPGPGGPPSPLFDPQGFQLSGGFVSGSSSNSTVIAPHTFFVGHTFLFPVNGVLGMPVGAVGEAVSIKVELDQINVGGMFWAYRAQVAPTVWINLGMGAVFNHTEINTNIFQTNILSPISLNTQLDARTNFLAPNFGINIGASSLFGLPALSGSITGTIAPGALWVDGSASQQFNCPTCAPAFRLINLNRSDDLDKFAYQATIAGTLGAQVFPGVIAYVSGGYVYNSATGFYVNAASNLDPPTHIATESTHNTFIRAGVNISSDFWAQGVNFGTGFTY